MLVALALAAISAVLARLFAAHSETLLAPFVHNVLLRSVVGSLISSMLVIGGLLLALGALKLTQAVLSILGLAAVVGLAVGFAFRDITENFIASVLLGVRRPFQIGDYVTVAGQSGVVKSLNTRATVLVTLEGNHVRIPNAVIFKEIMVNSTASPIVSQQLRRGDPPRSVDRRRPRRDRSGLSGQDGVLARPAPPRAVEALEPGGVRLRAYFWSLRPTASIGPAPERRQAQGQGRAPAGGRHSAAGNAEPADAAGQTEGVGPHRPIVTSGQSRSNLARDSHAPPRMVPQTVSMASSPRWCAPWNSPRPELARKGQTF